MFTEESGPGAPQTFVMFVIALTQSIDWLVELGEMISFQTPAAEVVVPL